MTLARTISFSFLAFVLIGFTGCVGPMAHGPLGGCAGSCTTGNSGSCDGCGELYVDPWINHPADCVDPCDTCGNYNGQSCGSCRPMFEGVWSLWGYRCGNDCGDCGDPGCAVSCGGGFLGGDACGCGAASCGVEVACGCDSCGIEAGCGVEVGCGCDSCGIEAGCGMEVGCGCDSCGIEAGCGMEVGCGCDACGYEGGDVIMDQGEVIYEGAHHHHGHVINGIPTPAPDTTIHSADKQFVPEKTRKIFNPKPRVATGEGRGVGY